MAHGFQVTECIHRPAEEVWEYLTDFENAHAWMTGIEDMTKTTPGPLAMGTCYTFHSRGKQRKTSVSSLTPGRQIALTSTQSGVTATYTYTVRPKGDGAEVSLDARCSATGLWALLRPLIASAMNRADGGQLARLASAMDSRKAGNRA